ncbi:dihydrolipoamide dehydrogenase [Saccharopolyspora lacisalsi]|uniref:Dihydrolipoamide dehydrogenase n=1 Tax=Halosaccharopolyspora lacisalsi TaxID=1000566 RepID=A0A839E3J7_9PSEU|nr:NAD(P)/FAD-dependent oxidoreductase [Halosaccharopolyspora lacisalsi]MBA8825498.1 dihydrolipoamide dehydrogenase [Halosaccharopolyspora lacisalsi]
MTETKRYDVVVLGGGAVGENAAARCASGGLSVVLVETDRFGGECSYWACMPSKALLRSGHALAAARRVGGAREAVSGDLDANEVLRRRDSFASHWNDSGQVDWAEGAGIEVVRGNAHLVGNRAVEVRGAEGALRLDANHAVVLCTGSAPNLPPVPGLDQVEPWTSREATSAQRVPSSLAVLGAGVVGVEMAQAWARLGSEVTLIDTGSRPLHGMEEFVGELVAQGLREDGVHLRTDTSLSRVTPEEGGVRLELQDGSSFSAQRLLVATGRRPGTEEIGLETVGLRPGEPLSVDDHGLVRGVDGRWLFVVGDATDQPRLTHQGKYAARIAADVIVAAADGTDVTGAADWSTYTATANHGAVPQVVFTDPEVATVGRTSSQAEREGYRTSTVDLELTVAGAVLHADGYRGSARMVVDEDRKVVLGVTFVGQDVAELLHSATIAVVAEVPLERLWHAVPPFPTISEVWLRLLENYGM